ncbi:MAG TPA: MarR family transcriptional regulator [Vicinamibacterales bacterium]|nr:MarR family transcriptional regulator [Vicinamibacterales bacterium]
MGAHTIRRTADTRAVLDAVRRIVRTLHESSRAAEKAVGVTGAQLFVLQKLAESPSASLNDLAARTHTHQSSVSTVVSRLVDRGLVIRAASATDGRRLELRLSAEGRRLLARAPDAAQARLVRAIEQLPAAHRHGLSRSLVELTNAMEVGGREPVMFFDETVHGTTRRRAARA